MGLRITAALVLLLAHGQAMAAECSVGNVSRVLFTDRIAEREPSATVSAVTEDTATLFAFTELMSMENQVIHHRWYYRDALVADVPLTVRGKRWRTWSSKNLGLRRDNQWSVRVTDADGCELARLSLLEQAPVTLVDPVLALLANGDIAGAKVLLAQTAAAHPDQAAALQWQLQPAIALAQAEQQISADSLYIAGARLQAIATTNSEQARKKRHLEDKLAARKDSLDRETALSLTALERVFAARLTPCPLASEQAGQHLAALADGQLSIMASEPGEQRWRLEVLDARTGTAHALQIACEAPSAG